MGIFGIFRRKKDIKKDIKKDTQGDIRTYLMDCTYCGKKLKLFEGKQLYSNTWFARNNNINSGTLCKKCEKKMLNEMSDIAKKFTTGNLVGLVKLKSSDDYCYIFECYEDK